MNIEQKISTYLEQQFPEIYREDGPFFVEFVKQYYVWLETDANSPVYLARQFFADHDIDTTVDDYIVHFKEKYLKNIQLNTATNTKQLIKNSINLYRSKGTEDGIKLFFDLIFSAPSEVYYPGTDVFKLSDAKWTIPQYIEVSTTAINRLMVGRQVKGVYSGATAFVERLVRRKAANTYIEVFYISALSGTLQTGEIITLSTNDGTYSLNQFPVMLGSLTSLEIIDGGDGFSKGEVVTLSSNTGSSGKAIVQDLQTITGVVSFDLVSGGWGYTANSIISVSNNVLQLSNVQLRTSDNTTLYDKITTIVQPMANVQWYANTNLPKTGATYYNYEANGQLRGISTIVSAEYGTNATSSYFLLSTSYGNSAPYTPMPYVYHTAGNTNSFTVYNGGWVDVSASGTLNGMSSNLVLTCAGSYTSFSNGEFVYQISSNNQVFARAQIIEVDNINASTFNITVDDLEGLFLTNFPLLGETNGGNVAINSAAFDIGIINANNNFITLAGNTVRDTSTNSMFSATCYQIPFGSGASVGFDLTLVNPETVSINPNFVRDHLDVTLQQNWINSASYGADLNDAGLNSPILGDALRFTSVTVGGLGRLTDANPGVDYSYAPFVIATDPLIAPLDKMDFAIDIVSPTGVFTIGEMVTQTEQGALGIVKSANSTVVRLQRITYEDRWLTGNTTPYQMVGQSSGFTAYPTYISDDVDGVIGKNAVIAANVTVSNSSVANLSVYDSGFNFKDGEELSFTSLDGERAGIAYGYVQTTGKGSGYSATTSGFLSSNKYIYDGDYYQDFSYEIRSPVTVDLYSDMLKNILHVAGTKSFSAFLKNSIIDSTTSRATSSIVSGSTILSSLDFTSSKNAQYTALI